MRNPFRRSPSRRVRADYALWDGLRQGWGMAVIWHHGFEKEGVDEVGRISGFDPDAPPRVGDVFYTDMKSGRRLLWLVENVERMRDPHDMFRADLGRIGYADENPLPPSTLVPAVRRPRLYF